MDFLPSHIVAMLQPVTAVLAQDMSSESLYSNNEPVTQTGKTLICIHHSCCINFLFYGSLFIHDVKIIVLF